MARRTEAAEAFAAEMEAKAADALSQLEEALDERHEAGVAASRAEAISHDLDEELDMARLMLHDAACKNAALHARVRQVRRARSRGHRSSEPRPAVCPLAGMLSNDSLCPLPGMRWR